MSAMTTLYISGGADGIRLFTRLDESEEAIVGNLYEIVYPGESFGGLTFGQLQQLACTTGKIDSEYLRVATDWQCDASMKPMRARVYRLPSRL